MFVLSLGLFSLLCSAVKQVHQKLRPGGENNYQQKLQLDKVRTVNGLPAWTQRRLSHNRRSLGDEVMHNNEVNKSSASDKRWLKDKLNLNNGISNMCLPDQRISASKINIWECCLFGTAAKAEDVLILIVQLPENSLLWKYRLQFCKLSSIYLISLTSCTPNDIWDQLHFQMILSMRKDFFYYCLKDTENIERVYLITEFDLYCLYSNKNLQQITKSLTHKQWKFSCFYFILYLMCNKWLLLRAVINFY